jgi:predicted metal-dependent phosphoesterase TrpH
MKIKADLHVHSIYSSDSLVTAKELVFYAKQSGLGAVAVTDHNCVEGSLRILEETDFLIIPATEVSSRDGHIVALNVKENIPRNLGASETIERIHSAGGLAVAVHPFALFKGSLGNHADDRFDAVETVNASAVPFRRNSDKSKHIANYFGKPCVAGTDAHYGPTIGFAYTVVEAEPNVESIVKAISLGRCEAFGKSVPWILKIQKQLRFYNQKIRGL